MGFGRSEVIIICPAMNNPMVDGINVEDIHDLWVLPMGYQWDFHYVNYL